MEERTSRLRSRRGRGGRLGWATAAALCLAGSLAAGPWAWPAVAETAAEAPGVERLLGGLPVYGPLAEIPAGHWAYRSLEELIAAGVVVEYSPGLLDGRHTISRYEAAMLLVDAFRRAGAVKESGPSSAGVKTLVVGELLRRARTEGLASDRAQRLEQVLRALTRELAAELAVLGYGLEGQPEPRLSGPSTELAVQVGSLPSRSAGTPPPRADGGSMSPSSSGGPGDAARSPAGASGQTGGEAAATSPSGSLPPSGEPGGALPSPGLRLPLPGYSYRLGLSLSEPGRFRVSGLLPLSGSAGPTEFGALMAMPEDQWLWTRVGEVAAPGGSLFAFGDQRLVGLQGIEAHLVGRDGKTGVVIARDTASADPRPDGSSSSPGAGAIAALGSSLVLSRDVVVGATIVRGASSTEALLSGLDSPTVTSVTTRLRPRPWLTLTGEYAQNLWALPVLDAAMRLDATLQLGDVRVGARIGSVSPDFRPALGQLRPGARVGVDTAVRMGELEVRAGTSRLDPADGGGAEISTAWGLTLGSVLGPSLEADFERVSVQELPGGQAPDRSRTALRVGWGTERTRLAMGVAWSQGGNPGGAGDAEPGLQAEAAIAYELSPGASVVFGYRLIDFGTAAASAVQSNASAQITLRF